MANEQHPLILCRKKSFCFDFMPSKAEEEACEANNTPRVMTRELIETGPATIFNPNYMSPIMKMITPVDITQGRLGISSFETIEYILPYWNLDKAKSLVNGYVERVPVLNVMENKKYEGETVTFRKLPNDEYSLTIVEVFNDRGLCVGDEIALFWDPRNPTFLFILLSKVGDSTSRLVLID